MPRSYQMSWDGSKDRWVKMYKGQRYTVACSVLNAPPSKEESYRQANAWWQKKRAEIDGERVTVDPRIEVLEEWSGQEITSKDELRSVLAAYVQEMSAARRGEPLLTREQHAKALGESRLRELETAVGAFRNPPVAVEGSVGAWAGAWHKHQEGQVGAGLLSAARCANNRHCLERFIAYAGSSSPVESVNAAKLQGFYAYCLEKVAERRRGGGDGWSVAFAKDVFSVTKALIRWLWEQDAIPLPKNVGSKSFKFGSGVKGIKTWTVDDFKRVVDETPGKLKLALLLMANCGMTQQDVSELRDCEVDWQAGRVIRKRSKTGDNENVPTVNYRLWPSTFALLKKYRSGAERVLLTESGQEYVRTKLREDGKLSKADGFASSFIHVKKRLGFVGSLKQLRSLGATLLETHKDYGRFKSYFLGHSPKTVADKHYARPAQELFDQAVSWLGEQLGQT